MATQLQNNEDGYTPMLPELDMVPQGPIDGAPAEPQDSDLIMRTLFGGDTPEPVTKSAGDQASGAKPADGAPQGSAPPAPAPAANEGVAASQPGTAPTPQSGNEQKPAGGPPSQTPAPGTPPAAVETPPAQSGLSAEDRLLLANARNLAEQNQQLLEQLRAGNVPQQPQTQQPQTGAQPGQQAPEPVHLSVPNDLYSAVFSEDEATSKHGINVLISAIATKAVQEAVARADTLINQRLADYAQGQQAHTSAQSQEQDFYEAFPSLKNELYLPVIQRESQAMYASMPGATWSNEFRDALGARVNRQLQLLGFNVGMVPAPASGQEQPPVQGFGTQPAAATPQPQPPAPMLDTSSRPAAVSDPGNFIAATFL